MPLAIDISILGDHELERDLERLVDAVQRKIVRQALRASARRIKAHVVANLSGSPVQTHRGVLRGAFEAAPVRSGGRSRRGIRLGIEWPAREALGIGASDPAFWPAAVEYGHAGAPPHPFLRPAVDEHESEEHRQIGADIGAGIEREARR